MIFTETPIPGAYLIDLEKRGDDRGFFARAFCEKEFAAHQLVTRFVQVNNSLSAQKGTLRGMHYQLAPKAETKLVRCIRGALYDLILDLRPGSPTFGQSFGAELTAENRRMMYVPKGFAHGFITLADDTEAFYFVDEFYAPECERGIRWNDPRFRPAWPIAPVVLLRQGRQPARLRSGLASLHLSRATQSMKILFTGGSSFTGFWFIRELAAAGHAVTAIFRKHPEEYPDDVRRQRVMLASEVCRPVYGCSFGDASFLAWSEKGVGPALPSRGRRHELQESRFRHDRRRRGTTHTTCLPCFERLKSAGCGKVLLSGSVFEGGEGAGSQGLPDFSPYGLSKALTAQVFRYYCDRAGLSLGKFVIPNPFGPYEEPRFTAYLMKTWLTGETPACSSPAYVRDNIHVSLLAKAYVRFAQSLAEGPAVRQAESQRLRRKPGSLHAPAGPGDAATAGAALPCGTEETDRLPRAARPDQHGHPRRRCSGLG